ncbi:MAG: AAA family ATPase [Dysgonamonadaceae bacterium]|jgi:exodeoxyribonuclease-5|nr:AAA family ATPase [Dysgonamonadaceae bacterium]
MASELFTKHILNKLPFEPTQGQKDAIDKLHDFLRSDDPEAAFLLKGYAGTGKTTLVAALVRTLEELNRKTILLAPTGRAAKIFSALAGQSASTIHRKIYRQKEYTGEAGEFVAGKNLHKNTLFIVDEASMIANDGKSTSTSFGTGQTLDDLIHYIYTGDNCRMLLLGDSAQLPPVTQSSSPALDNAIISGYGLHVHEVTLRQVVRQAEESGILANATMLRKIMEDDGTGNYPKLMTKNYPDLHIIDYTELIEELESAYRRDGIEETIVITRSNKRANQYNEGIRRQILCREENISAGDLLLVAKNNYLSSDMQGKIEFIANGDIIKIKHIGKSNERFGFHFTDITATFPDYGFDADLKVILETLHADAPALSQEANERLFRAVWESYDNITNKRTRMKSLKSDPYYNALQVKFAYAATCHKAQGGQWRNVFLDLSYVPAEHLGINFYRWLYTAITRATGHLYIINPPDNFLE